jgi:hypothetical protein
MTFKVGELDYKNGPAEIASWAKRRGFTEQKDGSYTAAVGDSEVMIHFRKLGITVTAKSSTGEYRLAAPNFVRLEIDDIDMLHGAGLASTFQQVYQDGTDVPWFPPALKIALDTLKTHPEGRRRGMAEIAMDETLKGPAL